MTMAQASLRVLAQSNKVEQALLLSRHSHHALLPKFPFRHLPSRPLSAQAKAQPDTSTSLQLQDSPKPPALARRNVVDYLDPFSMTTRSLRQMMAEMDRLFGEIATPRMDFAYMRAPWDVVETDDSYQMRIDLPGFEKDEVKLHVEDGVLIIHAHHNTEKSDQNKWDSRTRASFHTKVTLPKNTDMTKLRAKLNNGVLEVCIPKSKTPQQLIDVKIE